MEELLRNYNEVVDKLLHIGLSEEDLAEALCFHHKGMMWNVLRYKVHYLSSLNVMALIYTFDVNGKFLFTGQGDMFQKKSPYNSNKLKDIDKEGISSKMVKSMFRHINAMNKDFK